MSQTFEPQTEYKKLHPSSPLFILVDAIIKIIFPLVITYFLGGTSYLKEGWVIGIIAFLASIGTVAQYWFYHYWLEPDRIVIKSGIIFKSLRQVPYERIQNINIKNTILHQLFKVATVQIESASGSKPEAVIRVISLTQVKELQNAIKQKTKDISVTKDVTSDHLDSNQHASLPLYQITKADITRYGCIHWQALVPLAAVFGFAMQTDSMRERMTNFILSMVFYIRNYTALEGKLLNGIILVILLLIAAWLVSMVIAHLKLHGFTLTKNEHKLHAEMGLLTRITADIPIKRIQLIRIRESFMHRLFKRQTLTMETAGGVTQQTGIVMRWLVPLAKPEDISPLINKIEAKINLADMNWQNLSVKAWRRLFKKTSALNLCIIAILCLSWTTQAAWLLLTVPLWYGYARTWARHAAYAFDDHMIAYRSGVLFRNTSIVKINKIQTIRLLESPFDRRNHHGSLVVDTAGSNIALHHISIPYLEKDQLLKLHNQLTHQVSQSTFVW